MLLSGFRLRLGWFGWVFVGFAGLGVGFRGFCPGFARVWDGFGWVGRVFSLLPSKDEARMAGCLRSNC